MVVDELAYAIKDQNTNITVVAEKSKNTIEANAYLLKRLLYTVEAISADNIEITVKEENFDAIKNYLNK